MPWDEWEQLKAEAAGRAEARMSLASAAPGGTGGEGKLKHSGGPWTSASGAAGGLRTSTQTSRSRLRPAHEGVASGAAGLSSVAILNAVMESWEKRLTAVRGECDYLEGALLKVAKEMGESETAVKSSLNAVKTAIAGERP
ncbi:hypothetical protein [Streptomyces sp. ISL-100]|uniref:hypothetical protein n=1 Tax=Streptomyces sp. ISL-100 TaxID=2819173 RepID=UPI001BE577AB|nr:hypothetical protein [Streptomyces sp. ISL-100]MBT2395819.1 hypothetical protein [Streptomyces sp. ISL-100]